MKELSGLYSLEEYLDSNDFEPDQAITYLEEVLEGIHLQSQKLLARFVELADITREL